MKPFKFLSNGDYLFELPENMASWIWDGHAFIDPDTQDFELVTDYYDGIVDFLSQFPSNYNAVVKSIQGVASQIEHTYNTEQDGWGFNIQRDMLRITWYRFLGT
jgi:hypothetical protein